MAAYTSTKTGNWSDSTAWTPAGVPTTGDTVTIAAGHTITVNQNTTVGTSTAVTATLDVQISATGFLVIAPGITFQVNGSILIIASATANDALTVQAGATLIIDAPATTEQYVQWNTGATTGSRRLVFNGTAGARAAFRKGPSAGVVRTRLGGGTGGAVIATYTDFVGLGTSSINSISSTTAATYDFRNCVFDGCGAVQFSSTAATYVFVYRDNVHKNSPGAIVINANLGGTNSTGTREILRNVFDREFGSAGTNSMNGVTCEDNIAHNWSFNTTSVLATFKRNFLRHGAVGAGGRLQCGAPIIENNYWMNVNAGATPNPHSLGLGAVDIDQTVDGDIFDVVYSGAGDQILSTNPASSRGHLVKRCIVLPVGGPVTSGNTGGPFTLFEAMPLFRLSMEHNTWCANQYGIINYENSGAYGAGQVESIRSNIMFSSNGTPQSKLTATGGSATVDICAPANASHNCSDVMKTGAGITNGYEGNWSVAPGANDKNNVDPQFTDKTRNIATWDRYLVAKGLVNVASVQTWASFAASNNFAVGDIVKHSAPNFYSWAGNPVVYFRCISAHLKSAAQSEPGAGQGATSWLTYWELAPYYWLRELTISGTLITDAALGLTNARPQQALVAWVRAGFAPTNQALKAAGHDGADIGAVAVAAATPPPSTAKQSRVYSGVMVGV